MLNRGDYDEKRDHRRMGVDCPMTFKVEGGSEVYRGVARDLSATGMLIECETEIPVGTRLNINMAPPKSIVPPLDAIVEVIRSEAKQSGKFELGTTILEFHRGTD